MVCRVLHRILKGYPKGILKGSRYNLFVVVVVVLQYSENFFLQISSQSSQEDSIDHRICDSGQDIRTDSNVPLLSSVSNISQGQ